MSDAEIPDKLYYKIGEVAKITGVKAYVLRYWESEFRLIRPAKSRAGQRLYQRKDIEVLLQIRRLLYDEKYTIPGAKKQLRMMRGPEGKQQLALEFDEGGELVLGNADTEAELAHAERDDDDSDPADGAASEEGEDELAANDDGAMTGEGVAIVLETSWGSSAAMSAGGASPELSAAHPEPPAGGLPVPSDAPPRRLDLLSPPDLHFGLSVDRGFSAEVASRVLAGAQPLVFADPMSMALLDQALREATAILALVEGDAAVR